MGSIADLIQKIDQKNYLINGIKTEIIDQTGEDLPMVTVTMITYNHEKYIAKAIEGVVNQITNFKVVLLIGEDCSTDKTREIILSYQAKYPHIIQLKLPENNLGVMENSVSNKLLCRGKYIAENEGDDYWTDPYKLQKQVDFLENNPDYVLCFHQVKILKPNGTLVDDFITRVPDHYETHDTLARLGNYIHTPSVVFRNIIQNFPFEYFLTSVGDYFLYLLLAEHGKLKCLDQEMAVYRFGVGVHSANSIYNQRKNQVKLFALLLSVSADEKIRKIFLERQFQSLDSFEKVIHNGYNEYFVSNHVFFRIVNILKTPRKLISKIKKRCFAQK